VSPRKIATANSEKTARRPKPGQGTPAGALVIDVMAAASQDEVRVRCHAR
jgi:hypothetical protein